MRTVLGIAGFVVALLYPGIVYFALTRMDARELAWLLLPVVLLAALSRLPRERRAHSLGGIAPALRGGTMSMRALATPAAMAGLIALTALLDDRRFLLVMPVLVNAILFAGFAGSLLGETPLIERFARIQVDDLSPAEVEYCRHVTWTWSAFFVVNGGIAALLAWLAPLSWWALYTGFLSYVMIGLLGATEYVIRKYRFGRYGATPIDRILRAVLERRPVNG